MKKDTSNTLSETLYISIDGIMEPLGYSQVFKYLENLSKDYQINLISFEKIHSLKDVDALTDMIKKCDQNNIIWYRLKYRNGFFGFGKLINIFNLFIWPIYINLKRKISIVHIRSYMPCLAIPLLKFFFKFNFIFDIRGFWADEKHDRLGWSKQSYKYKFFKILEKYLFKKADFIVTLTKQSKYIIANNFKKKPSRIKVIPTCVDSEEICIQSFIRKSNNLVVGYLGSTDTAYDFNKFCFFLNQIKTLECGIELRVFTGQKTKAVKEALARNNLGDVKKQIRFIDRKDLAYELSQLDWLGFYLKENFSIKASMPTKIAEALSCGVPIICNPFNLDIEELIGSNNIGLIYNFTDELQKIEIDKILEYRSNDHIKNRCVEIANTHFSIAQANIEYDAIYSKLNY